MMKLVEAVTAAAAVILILLLAWWWSRFLGRRMSGAAGGRYMKVIDSIMIGRDKQLLLVKVREETFLVGVSAQEISFMTRVEEEFPDIVPDAGNGAAGMPFSEALQQVLKQMKNRKEHEKDE